MFRRPIVLLAGLLCYLAFIAAFLYAVDYLGKRIAPVLLVAERTAATANARRNPVPAIGALPPAAARPRQSSAEDHPDARLLPAPQPPHLLKRRYT